MKDQYVGDIGDYGKYGLLRFLANHGIKIGVNWYRTKNDVPPTNDGKMNQYLNDPYTYSCFDKDLFSELQKMDPENRWKTKSVLDVENVNLIPDAVYYHEVLDTTSLPKTERKTARTKWHQNALHALTDAQLIFADPDNGTLGGKNITQKNAEKYVDPVELLEYYKKGKDLVYYCHRARQSKVKWLDTVTEMKKYCTDSHILVLTSHRGTQRSYIFVIHSGSMKKYKNLLNDFLQEDWGVLKRNNWKDPFFTFDYISE